MPSALITGVGSPRLLWQGNMETHATLTFAVLNKGAKDGFMLVESSQDGVTWEDKDTSASGASREVAVPAGKQNSLDVLTKKRRYWRLWFYTTPPYTDQTDITWEAAAIS